MADIQLTAQQRGAVEDRGGSLLVSAAAGSGKTKVLVERVFAYLTEEHCHIDDFLIITFTRAAAAELRTKLAAELAKRVAQDPENSHLRQQMFRVYQADIKTVDGFCAGLLREHIHLLEPVDGRSLTPDFRILDETEAGVLKQRALEDALEAVKEGTMQGTVYNDNVDQAGEIARLAVDLFKGNDISKHKLKDGRYYMSLYQKVETGNVDEFLEK